MTELDLNTIEARANAATQGPWQVRSSNVWGDDYSNVSIQPVNHSDDSDMAHACCDPLDDEDVEFIAHAREDVPALVAEVRQLRAARDRVLKRHFPIEALMYTGKQQRLVKVCGECGTDDGNWKRHPCQTVIDLEGETP